MKNIFFDRKGFVTKRLKKIWAKQLKTEKNIQENRGFDNSAFLLTWILSLKFCHALF